jgi:hypothetical protein
MTMNQPAQAQQTQREEERVLGISYDRAIQMIPKLIRQASGSNPEELGDGYYVAKLEGSAGSQKREITVRLGRQGPDTRISVRVESFANPLYISIIIVVAIATLGIGVLPLIPWMQSIARKEGRERELLVHKTFRAIEEAVAQQGVSTNYRIGPGADANIPAVAADAETAAQQLAEGEAAENEEETAAQQPATQQKL